MAIKDFWEFDLDDEAEWMKTSRRLDKVEAFLMGQVDVDEFDDIEENKKETIKKARSKAFC